MQKNNRSILGIRVLAFLLSGFLIAAAQAGTPLWTFEPLTATQVAVPANSTAIVQYRVTNQSRKPHTLVMQSIPGITQITSGLGVCGSVFVLRSQGSCVLSLQINGSELSGSITDGPVVCQQGSSLQCYRPSLANVLRITVSPPILDATITVTGSPLILTELGPSGQLTITNTSTQVSASSIVSNFIGTALQGNVTETGNTCANVPPGGSCTLTYTPGNTVVPQTDFTIQGTNTNVLNAAIAIVPQPTLTAVNPNSGPTVGGTGVTLTGTELTGATSVTFGGVDATDVNVVNSTTVTAMTPSGTVGSVNVVINTPAGAATLTNGYTYVATAVGESANGGTVACVGGGALNLVASTLDNSDGIQWGGGGTVTGATSTLHGALNTETIVTVLGAGSYAAQLCNDFEVDSQGNTPCQAGNACYNDWFLPAQIQSDCLCTNKLAIGGFSGGLYWTSTEVSASFAIGQDFAGCHQGNGNKGTDFEVRCVRHFGAVSIGQQMDGGVVACLNGGLNNLIAATADNSAGIQWGGLGTTIGAGAQSTADGASNTTAIVTELGNNGGVPYAAQLCNDYEVDSQGNTPCQVGNICYNDWFLPAQTQLNCLCANKPIIGGFSNGIYWASTEVSANLAIGQDFAGCNQGNGNKGTAFEVRCVRAFSP